MTLLQAPIRSLLAGFPLDMLVMWISVLLTVISGVDYVVKNKDAVRFD